jgi:hypothetical protein
MKQTTDTAPRADRIIAARTADDLLTALATIDQDNRERALSIRNVTILREAADLCGVDAVELTKRQAITAIVQNF